MSAQTPNRCYDWQSKVPVPDGSTEYNDGTILLKGLTVDCGSFSGALQSFYLQRTDANGNPNAEFRTHIRYFYTCCDDDRISYYGKSSYGTSNPFSTDLGRYYATKTAEPGATVQCGDGGVLHSFEYIAGDVPDTLKIKYRCIITTPGLVPGLQPQSTTPTQTGTDEDYKDGRFWVIWLDRQKVECPKDSWLTGFTGPRFASENGKYSWSYRFSCMYRPLAERASALTINETIVAAPAPAPAPEPAPSGAVQRGLAVSAAAAMAITLLLAAF